MFYGRGAGKLPTANAVVSDIIDAIKHKSVNIVIRWSEHKDENQTDGSEIKYKFYKFSLGLS